jgi:hypothetical protein
MVLIEKTARTKSRITLVKKLAKANSHANRIILNDYANRFRLGQTGLKPVAAQPLWNQKINIPLTCQD